MSYTTLCDKLRLITDASLLLEFLEKTFCLFISSHFGTFFITMSSLASRNWRKHLQEDMDEILSLSLDYVLHRVKDRVEKRKLDSRKKKRSCWVRPWLLRRYELGYYDNLMVELANEDIEGYISFQRLNPELFAELLAKVTPYIQKKDTVMRPAISAGARLAVTLRYLATGKLTYSIEFLNISLHNILPNSCMHAYFHILFHILIHYLSTFTFHSR